MEVGQDEGIYRKQWNYQDNVGGIGTHEFQLVKHARNQNPNNILQWEEYEWITDEIEIDFFAKMAGHQWLVTVEESSESFSTSGVSLFSFSFSFSFSFNELTPTYTRTRKRERDSQDFIHGVSEQNTRSKLSIYIAIR